MTEKLKIIAALPPRYVINNPHPDCEEAHMTYCIGRRSRLYKSREDIPRAGGFMVLEIGRLEGGGPSSAIIGNVLGECERRRFLGVVLDSGGRGKTAVTLSLAHALASALREKGLLFFVPEEFSAAGERAIIRVQAALSGGTLTRHLRDFAEKYGAQRVAVEIERVRMDFSLPERSGLGRDLSPAELDGLIAKHAGQIFYSQELAANYFSYTEKGKTGFVLFDDANSIKQKLTIARETGIRFAFLFYPQVTDIFDEILEF